MLNTFPSAEEYQVFQNELLSASEVSSPYVIHYEYLHDGTIFVDMPPYIIMDYAPDGTLETLIDIRRKDYSFFTNSELKDMMLQLSYGMQAINEKLVHRDIKPQNVLVNAAKLQIADFGLAKYSEATTREITFKGYGTAPYCAPEVWKRETNSIQMDIYSMGIVFYELATLDYPYNISNSDYSKAHLFESIIPPNNFNNNLSPTLVSVINKMLQKPRSKRFSNWNDIISFLNSDTKLSSKDSSILSLVQANVAMQNATDSAIQKKQAEEAIQKEEKETLCKNIMFHLKNEVLDKIKEYSDLFNLQYASGKIVLHDQSFNINSKTNKVTLRMPNMQTITISLEIIFPEDFTNINRYATNGSLRIPTSMKAPLPTCNHKRVLAWGKIEDNFNHGYNILLLDNSQDEYGDWYILYNNNSGLSRTLRTQPFAFNYDELPRELTLINATHIYTSQVENYNFDRFQELIAFGQLNSM